MSTVPRLMVIDDDRQYLDRVVADQQAWFDIRTSVEPERFFLNPELCDEFDALLIDVHMPKIDGLNLCLELKRKIATPIFLNTSDESEATKLTGLKMKVDDFLSKEMSANEVRLRILNALSRRRIRLKSLVFNLDSGEVNLAQAPLFLTQAERSILKKLLESPGYQVGREQLCQSIWKGRLVVSHTLNSHVHNLNRKITAWEYFVKIEKTGVVSLQPQASEN